MTVPEAARRLRRAESTVLHWCETKQLTAQKRGVRVPRVRAGTRHTVWVERYWIDPRSVARAVARLR